MPISHVSKVFAVKDAKVRKILTDPAGGATTKGASIDVPGIKSVTVNGTVDTKVLRGDNGKLDQSSVLTDVGLVFTYAKLSLDVLPVIIGGATTDSGTTPSQLAQWRLTAANAGFSPFEFEAQAVGADTITGDSTLLLYKCVLSGFPEGIGMAEEDYAGPYSVPAGCSPRLSDGFWLDVVLRETAAALV